MFKMCNKIIENCVIEKLNTLTSQNLRGRITNRYNDRLLLSPIKHTFLEVG